MELSRLALGLILISVLSFARGQVDCPPFNVSALGATDMLTPGGLIGYAFVSRIGDPTVPVSVQVHDSNIVCLRSGRTRDTYRGVSVVVRYSCTGPLSECTGNPTLSQFEFECATGPTWTASVDGSASNIITTPPNGTLSTPLRTDCGVCISPARSGFASITNNEQHCGSCNSACSVGLMKCFSRSGSDCCNFFESGTCVGNCSSSLVTNSSFDCVVNCSFVLEPNNGVVSYNPQGQNQTLVGATVNYTCNSGYTLNGNNMRTCQANGTWSGSDPTCNIVNCSFVLEPNNGVVSYNPQGQNQTLVGATVNYACNSGYTLNGNNMRTCQANGTWSGSDPTCNIVNCSFVLEPNNGVVSYNPQGQNQTLVGATVNYTCNSGYTLNGNNMRTCQANGTWSGSDPTCNTIAQTCEHQMICSDCIRATGCVWCADPNFVGSRCQNGSSIPGCNILQDCSGEITPSNPANNPVSIQNIRLNLRLGEPVTFMVNVTALRNLPLDLYILMDLSSSMSDELYTVKSIAGQIANRINAITTNVRLGFGSFSDKVTRPFTYDACDPNMRREDCSLYAFRHQIDLTSDITAFNNSIQAVATTVNADSPENGLEALAQVISCEDVIGWRSRDATGIERGLTRIVLFLTDEQFHYSGEGRLAGILRPYDGQCYLMRNENTPLPINYLRWDEFDYPSVGQIISLLTQFQVTTIFAVAEDVLPTYQNLQDLVNQQYRAHSAILTSDSVQLLNLIETEYRASLQDIRLLPPPTTDSDLQFSIQATCPASATQPSVDTCAGVPLDNTVTFNVTVTLTSCDAFRNRTTPIIARVNVPGFGGFNITYTGVCSSDYEQSMNQWRVTTFDFITRPGSQHANLNNLDIQEPIVRRSPADDADFFGWATVLHQIQTVGDADDLDTAAGRTRIIVGAPMGTFPGGLPLPDPGLSAVNQTGLVYSCPMQPGACEGVQGDMSIYAGNPDGTGAVRDLPDNGAVIEGRLFDQAPNALVVLPFVGSFGIQFEIKTGQLMGATLYSTGENFVACAPRWTATLFTSEDEQPRGACYASGRQLTNFQFLQPCFGESSSTYNTGGVGYCMAGVSVTRVGNVYAIAAPGYNVLRGRVYYGANNTAIRSGRGESRQPDSSGNLVEIRNQYQGFQTTTGFITQRQDPDNNGQVPDHIATVPRYNGTTYRGRVNIVNQQSGLTGPYLDITAEGQQMGEFFGYSIAAADLNGDGFDELVVGAPMYTDIHQAATEIGRVYVFNNTGGNLSQTSMVLEGQVERGRFGTSVVNLGDIDDDSYEDIAVGAPYADNGNNNQGAVYIYYGRADIAEFAQQTPFEIRAEQIVDVVEGLNELRTFGWSLSSGVDVDNNQYKDLSVGAYESKTVVLLRTLPVANVNVSFDAVPPVDLNVMSCSLGPCFNLTIRATYAGRGLSGELDIDYILSANTISTVANVHNRLVFDAQNSTQVTRTLSFNAPGTEITDTVTVYARNYLDDVVTSYELQIELQNITRDRRNDIDGNQTLTDLSMFPRLRVTGASTTTVRITGVLVGFEQPSYSVREDVGQFRVCVVVIRPSQSDPLNQTFSLSVSTRTGTAGSNDFTPIINQDVGPFSNTQRRQCFFVEITNGEMIPENVETFFLNLIRRPGEVLQQVTINPAVAEITIIDNDVSNVIICSVTQPLIVSPFQSSINYSFRGSCEHVIVSPCDGSPDFRITVDFLADTLQNGRIGASYNGRMYVSREDGTVTVDSNTQVISMSGNTIVYQGNVAVTSDSAANKTTIDFQDLGVTIVHQFGQDPFFQVNISDTRTLRETCGLCGTTEGVLLYRNGNIANIMNRTEVDAFANSYLVAPRDQFLHPQRRECGQVTNDTVNGDPLFTVPISPDGRSLCFQIHGQANTIFNLVSDVCTSINANYTAMNIPENGNIISQIGVLAKPNAGQCNNVRVELEGCRAFVDDTEVIGMWNEEGIAVRRMRNRVRISVPNCDNLNLVMWVMCQNNSGQPMIRFVITRGLNLRPTSHGLLGQFWNIPVDVTRFTGTVDRSGGILNPDELYVVTVAPEDGSPLRSFLAEQFFPTWENRPGPCLYAGNAQGGWSGEVNGLNNPVIQGSYKDYIVNGLFETDFTYSRFEEQNC